MPRRNLLTATFALLLGVGQSVAAQSVAPGTVRPVELVRPVYHPIAVSAGVSGDVVVVVRVRPDGGLAGMDLVRGIPLLTEACQRAIEASRFECIDCVDEQRHTITYSFGFDLAQKEPETDAQTGSRVQITAASPVVSHGPVPRPVRSSKCLYLWRCGWRS